VREDVEEMVRDHGVVYRLLQRVSDRVERWYHSEGFALAKVVKFQDPSSGEVACEVREGDITRAEYKFVDELGNAVDGKTRIPVIERELPKQVYKL
jgi:outer membrane protein assembly factor BamA